MDDDFMAIHYFELAIDIGILANLEAYQWNNGHAMVDWIASWNFEGMLLNNQAFIGHVMDK